MAPTLSLYRMLPLSVPFLSRATLDVRKYGEGRWRTGAQVTAPLQLPRSPLGICFWVFFPTCPGLAGLCAVSSSLLHSCHHQLSSWLLSQIALPSSCLLWGWDQARGSRRDLELLWHGVGMALECSERNCNGKREEETTPGSHRNQSGCSGRTDGQYSECNSFTVIFSSLLPFPFAASPF